MTTALAAASHAAAAAAATAAATASYKVTCAGEGRLLLVGGLGVALLGARLTLLGRGRL